MSLIVALVFKQIFVIGLSFSANTESCGPNRHWVVAHTRRTKTGSTWVKEHCQDNPSGYEFWSKKVNRTKPREWEHPSEKVLEWKVSELEDVVKALGEVPEIFRDERISIHRMKNSVFPMNRASSYRYQIALYDRAFDGKVSVGQVLTHEFAHIMYSSLSDSDRIDYQVSTGWVNWNDSPTDAFIRRQSGYVELDGKNDPAEDFANNVEYFLYHPETLRRVTPQAYTWIRKHFGDSFKLRK